MSQRQPTKKTYEQLQEILTEAERVNTVLVNDYTKLKERDRNMTKLVEEATKKYEEAAEEVNRLHPMHDNELVKRTVCEKKLEDMYTKVEEAEGQLYDQISRCKELEITVQENDKQIADLKKTKDLMKRKNEEGQLKVTHLEDENNHYIELLTQTKHELATARAQVCDLESRTSELEQLLGMEQVNRIKIETQLEQLQMHRLGLEKQCNSQEAVFSKREEDARHHLELVEKSRKDIAEQLIQEQKKVASLEELKSTFEKKLAEKDATVEELHKKVLQEISKRATVEEDLENQLESLRRDKEHSDKTMKKMENMLEEANKLYQEMEKQFEEGQRRVQALQTDLARTVLERDTANNELNRERENKKEANEREQEIYKKLQISETALLDLKHKVRQLEEQADLSRRQGFDALLSADVHKTNGANHENHDDPNNGGDAMSPWLQKIQDEKKEIAKIYAQLDQERAKLKVELRTYEDERRMFMDDLQRITEEKASLMQKTTEYIREKKVMDEERKRWEVEREKIDEEQNAVIEDKTAIDNELRKLVVQRLELQDSKRLLEEKETQVLELEVRLKEMEAKLAVEHKQNEILELKLSTGVPAPVTPTTPTHPHTPHERFSIFSPKTNKEKDSVFVSQATNDEERKKLLFDEYGSLLSDVNAALFQKREALNELETKDGKKFLRKLPISNLKSAIAKLETLQDKTKKALRAVDDKHGIALADENGEYVNLKSLKSELDNM